MTGFMARIYAFKFFDGFMLIAPLYTVMFVDAGLKPMQISVVLTAWSVTTFVLQAPSGLVADRLPRKWVLAGAQVARAVGFVAWAVDPHFWGYLVGLVLWGVKSAFTSGTFEALLYDELKAQDRAGDYPRVIGRARAAQALAALKRQQDLLRLAAVLAKAFPAVQARVGERYAELIDVGVQHGQAHGLQHPHSVGPSPRQVSLR